MQIAVARVVETGLPMIYANQMGGQDELVFDGGSFGLHGDRTLAFQMQQFETGVALTRWERGDRGWRCTDGPMANLPSTDAANWQACVLGLRDYVEKNGFRGRGARAFGRHRFRRLRGDGGRCARAPTACAASCCPIATRRRTA